MGRDLKHSMDVLLLNYTLAYRGLLPPMGSVGHLDSSKDTLPERQERRGHLQANTVDLFKDDLLKFETKEELIDAFDECTSDDKESGKKYLSSEDREDILSKYDSLKEMDGDVEIKLGRMLGNYKAVYGGGYLTGFPKTVENVRLVDPGVHFERDLLGFETKEALIEALDEYTRDDKDAALYLRAEQREDILYLYDTFKESIG